ncbi:MAG: T9SS type A sorting domain-containing protein [Bacteroidota bacterium]
MNKLFFGLLILLSHQCFAQTIPSIQFTFVPEWGNSDFLKGKANNISINNYGVAVYIFVEEAGGWWNKPFTANPVTQIQPDSSFSTNIVTAGIDQFATKIIAFLIPLSFSPPILSGGDLPNILFSYQYVVLCRPHGERTISWSGFDWIVKKSVGSSLLPIGPGPNIFNDNDSMVWVDDQQRLHMRIAKNGDKWHCSEIICKTSQGYKRYSFEVGSRVDLFNPNIIAGIFTWDDCSPLAHPPNDFFREIDIEFSRWGNPNNKYSQYVIQPYNISGNINRYNMNLTGLDHSVHYFDWTADSIVFKSIWGDSTFSWKYSNPDYIPTPGNENIRVNLHLLNGKPPSDNMNSEFVLNSFITNIIEPGNVNKDIKIFPNPIQRGCMIDIQSSSIKDIEIAIVTLQGKLIRKLFFGKIAIGSTRIEWDGRTENGKLVQPGLYLICFKDKIETKYFKIIKM